jgi:serine/threonine protein kinase
VLAWKEIVILDENKEKMKQEAELTSKVESPFIAPLLDNFEEEEEGIFYLVEEFYEDGTLGTLLDELTKSGKRISKEVCTLF